jgi:hypothetical protein
MPIPTRLRSAFLVLCALALQHCAITSCPYSPPAHHLLPLTHTVAHAGETLGTISAWYTGTPSNWQKIAAANGGLDARHIRVGQVIVIPANLVIRREPMRPAEVLAVKAAELPKTRNVDWKDLGDYIYPDERARYRMN